MQRVLLAANLVALTSVGLVFIAATASAQSQTSTTAAEFAAMKADYRRPSARPVENQSLVELGRHLFWDPRISASGKTSCVSCHLPELGWGALDQRSRNDSGRLTSRRSQPLVGVGYITKPHIGWDGRAASLEAQVKNSIATGAMSMRETETPVKVEVIEARIRTIPEYAHMFSAALPGAPITLDTIARAIAAFERTMEPGIAPFDRWIEGDEAAISDQAKRGFSLFSGKANCFACHGTWRFTDDLFHDIGTTKTDLGRGREIKNDEVMQYAFKTPTLRSVAGRPPYMHHGQTRTLYDVVKHYETEGIDRPSRSPLYVPVALSEQERQDLVVFMQTLTGPQESRAPALPRFTQ